MDTSRFDEICKVGTSEICRRWWIPACEFYFLGVFSDSSQVFGLCLWLQVQSKHIKTHNSQDSTLAALYVQKESPEWLVSAVEQVLTDYSHLTADILWNREIHDRQFKSI